MRHLPLVLAGLLSLTLALSAAAAPSAPWFHVRVTGADGADRVNLNLPFSLAEGLIQMAEQSEINTEIKNGLPAGLGLADLRKMWKDLKGAGDAEFLTMQSGEEEVRMSFEGKNLRIDVKEANDADVDQLVQVNLPTSLVDALLSGQGDQLNLRAALRELREGHVGDIVNVIDGDEMVRVWME